MIWKKVDDGFYLVFEPGDKVIESFTKFCKDHHLRTGIFSGIGAFSKITLGHYNITTKRYMEKDVSDSLEVLSVNGNVTIKEKEPFVHMHAIVSDANMNFYGGHVIEAEVSVTLELHVTDFRETLHREFDEELGLFTIK
ncbi:MAG: DUF296 domain-containing protein [Candidatus Muiribacterium halophilum]|uniref:DUF296 domain-containing protein n=1 Tax=Muiribacterium halophilum TaxID=2053465 RepID=A0A2N5ZKD2_MUIH1|nr:MAG: DUF296 domain-containing protein [Candidatus Muirbacterium halophilum]